MRIDKLHLTSFKNLIDFDIDFDETSPKQVLIGRNGVGKSNVMEAITKIFRDLNLDDETYFEYSIRYECNSNNLMIENRQTNNDDCLIDKFIEPKFQKTYYIKDKVYTKISKKEFTKNIKKYTPSYVFGYYSGIVDRFNNIFKRHEEIYYKQQAEGEELPLRPIFQAKPHHSQFTLLSFYASEDKEAQAFLRNEMGIIGIESVLFSIREPYWRQKNPSKQKKEKGDARFWYAGGKVAPFLNELLEYSFFPMKGGHKVEIALGKTKNKERRYCFIDSLEKLHKLAHGLESKEFFARLESLFFSDLIDASGNDIQINIKLENSEDTIIFNELSEGERQLITILGLMRFTAEKEALFLLDEPDTHLNPAWCLDYLHNLKTYGAEPPNSHIILTTHNPLTFAGLDKNEVVIMEKTEGSRIYCEHPLTAPKGMGFSAILTSKYFGLRSALDKETLNKLDKKRELGLKENKTDEEREELAKLNDELSKLDFSKSARDPLYNEYIKAITKEQIKNPELKDPTPDMVNWEKRKRIAQDIANMLLKKR